MPTLLDDLLQDTSTPRHLDTSLGVVAGALFLGADTGSSGISQVWAGERMSTALEKTVDAGSQMMGVSPETAANASMVIGAIGRPTKIVGEVAHYGMDIAKNEVKAQVAQQVQEQLGIEVPSASGNGKNKGKSKSKNTDNKKVGKKVRVIRSVHPKGKPSVRETAQRKLLTSK